MDELLTHFLVEGRELTAQAGDDLAALVGAPSDRARIDSAFRAIHTLKGSVAIFDMAPAGRALHAAEDVLDRTRAGLRALDPASLSSLVAVVDQTDRWIDAMERNGTLPASAPADADALIARLGSGGQHDAMPAPDNEATAPWRDALIERHRAAIAAASSDMVAFRYEPDRDCFFRGDDPLAIVAGVPDIVALSIVPHQAWSAIETFEPFHCTVTIDGLSSAPMGDVRAAFRFVADEVALSVVAAPVRDLDDVPGQPGAARSLRVDAERVDALADGVGELLVASNALAHVVDQAARIDGQLAGQLRTTHATLERAIDAMRRSVVALRMVSLGPSLRRLPRMVREIADALGRDVQLTISGETTEVDKGIADSLFEPLLHLVRNAIDHGIESAATRRAAGKPDTGQLRLAISRDGDHVIVALADDGAGIDVAGIRAVAVGRGLIARDAADALSDDDAMRLIFAPGFSTRSDVSAVSGRGVGMDAVLAAVDRLGGNVEIASIAGTGTTIRLRLPLNAIMTRLLIVRAGGEHYGVPIDRIIETASVASDRIVPVGPGRACVLRDRTVPILSLATLLGDEATASPVARILVTGSAAEPVGVMVDGFGARIDGLVRPATGLVARIPGVAGTTLLGDGDVLLVLDLAELLA